MTRASSIFLLFTAIACGHRAPKPAGEWTADATPYYDDLSTHKGCTTAGFSAEDGSYYTAAEIEGYPCLAQELAFPDGVNEDTSKPVVILLHGNADSPMEYQTCNKAAMIHTPLPDGTLKAAPLFSVLNCKDTTTPGLANQLVARGYKVFLADFRTDMVYTTLAPNYKTPGLPETSNGLSFDHAWSVPIAQSLIKALYNKYPKRQFAVVGFSLGVTIGRDALRRLHRDGERPFERLSTFVGISGANHGVKGGHTYCPDPTNPPGPNISLLNRGGCELGDRDNYSPTPFMNPLNGPEGAFETPCADGDKAYGQADECNGNKVKYFTIVHQDEVGGSLLDEFVSQGSAALNGAVRNDTVPYTELQQDGYFLNNALPHHFASIRTEAGIGLALACFGETL